MGLFLLLLLLLLPPQDDAPTAEQCQRVISEAHAAIQDLSFIYEGEIRTRAPSDEATPNISTFQGRYFYRARDGATSIDVYSRLGHDEAFVSRHRMALVGGKLQEHEDKPDLSPLLAEVREGKGSGGSLNAARSPNRLLWLWYFRENLDLSALDYEYLGLEEIDGHVCWHFQVNSFPAGTRKHHNEFWVDVERGGHPLRVDMYRRDRLFLSIRDVQLKQYPSGKDQSVWLPVRATVDGYDERNPSNTEPFGQETYELVSGSVLVNRGIPDERFRIDLSSPGDPTADMGAMDSELKTLRASHEARTREVRTDPEGIRRKLEEQLASADQQARQLEASSPARQRFGSSALLRWGFVGLGVVLAAAAVILVRRGRG